MEDKTLILIEERGDIAFYKDDDGNEYQQVQGGKKFPVEDGVMAYQVVKDIGDLTIKYNKNGVTGFSIWRGDTCLEDRYWFYERVLESAKELK